MDNQTFLDASEDYFAGAFDMIDEDLPDGAWFQMHVDIAERTLPEICTDMGISKPDVDGYEITHHYLAKSK